MIAVYPLAAVGCWVTVAVPLSKGAKRVTPTIAAVDASGGNNCSYLEESQLQLLFSGVETSGHAGYQSTSFNVVG